MKVKLNHPWPPASAPGEVESHYGFPFTVTEDGGLVAEIDDVMAAGEIAAGRMLPLEAAVPVIVPLDEMTVKELRAFAGEHGITLGSEATTKEAILAVIQAAAEAKE